MKKDATPLRNATNHKPSSTLWRAALGMALVFTALPAPASATTGFEETGVTFQMTNEQVDCGDSSLPAALRRCIAESASDAAAGRLHGRVKLGPLANLPFYEAYDGRAFLGMDRIESFGGPVRWVDYQVHANVRASSCDTTGWASSWVWAMAYLSDPVTGQILGDEGVAWFPFTELCADPWDEPVAQSVTLHMRAFGLGQATQMRLTFAMALEVRLDPQGPTDSASVMGEVELTSIERQIQRASGLPDLMPSPYQAEVVGHAEQAMNLTARFMNNDSGDAGRFRLVLEDGGQRVGAGTVMSLAGGTMGSATISWTPPACTPLAGESGCLHTLEFVLNPRDRVQESDEANNRGHIFVYVLPE